MATTLDEERKKTQVRAPTPAASTARPSNFMSDTNAVMDGVGQNLSDQLRQGRVGAAIGETARGAAAMIPALVNDVVLRPLAPVGRGMVDAVSTFAGGAAPSPAPAAPATPSPPRLGVGTGDARRTANDFDRSKVPAAPPSPAVPGPDSLNGFQPTRVGGVYRRGNAFSDAAGVNDDALWKRGAVTPENNAAASALSMGSAAQPNTVTVEAAPPATAPGGSAPVTSASPIPTVTATATPASTGAAPGVGSSQPAAPGFGATPSATASAPASVGLGANQQALARMQANTSASAPGLGVQMPTLRHSGNDWQARTDLRNARVSANSLSNDGRWGGRGGKSPDVLAYEAALATDEAAKQGRNPLAQEVVQQQGLGARTRMQEDGALARTGMQEVGLGARARMTNDIQQGELGIKQGEFGARRRSADRLDEAQAAYLGAKTPEARARAAQNLRMLAGRGEEVTAKDRYLITGGEKRTVNGETIQDPQRIFDTRTRQFVEQGGAPLPPDMTKQVGTSGGKPVYEDANGRRFVGG